MPDTFFAKDDQGDTSWLPGTGGGGGAPATSKYITQQADVGLPQAQALDLIAVGILQNDALGVLSNAPHVTSIEVQVPAQGALLQGTGIGYSALPIGANGEVLTSNGTAAAWAAGGGGAPTTPTYILQSPDGALPNAQALNAMAGGILQSAPTGVISVNTLLTSLTGVPIATGTLLQGVGTSLTNLVIGANNTVLTSDGTNASWQSSALPAGTDAIPALASSVMVNTAAVKTASKVFLTWDEDPGVAGILYVSNIVDSTSFVINSSIAIGAAPINVNWLIIN